MSKKHLSRRPETLLSKSNTKFLNFLLVLFAALAFITCRTAQGEGSAAAVTESPLPVCPAVAEGRSVPDHEVHEYANFTLCYRESYEEAEWVSYTLTPELLVRNSDRTEDFREDPAITTGSATLADYRGSGYDRGHLSPARDNARSQEIMSESFLMSNMTPQTADFNRGIWNDLEGAVRTWAEGAVSVRVVTGPVLDKAAEEYAHIGESPVAVPEYFYKVLLATLTDGTLEAAGFVLPNLGYDGTPVDFEVSVDEVERITGLDFFSDLENTLEDSVESVPGVYFQNIIP